MQIWFKKMWPQGSRCIGREVSLFFFVFFFLPFRLMFSFRSVKCPKTKYKSLKTLRFHVPSLFAVFHASCFFPSFNLVGSPPYHVTFVTPWFRRRRQGQKARWRRLLQCSSSGQMRVLRRSSPARRQPPSARTSSRTRNLPSAR